MGTSTSKSERSGKDSHALESITDAKEIIERASKDLTFLRAVHGQGFSGTVSRSLYEQATGSKVFGETAQAFQMDVMARLEANDPLEQMLIDQMLWTHIRIGRLSVLATQQSGVKQLQVVHEAADRALNAFRRQMLALQEYRRPRPPASFTAIKQQNIALVNGSQAEKSQIKNVTNEKENTNGPAETKSLPADTGSIGLPSEFHPAREAVAVGQRPQDAGR